MKIIAGIFQFARLLRIVCAGFQVADAVINLQKVVSELDTLRTEIQRLSDTLGDVNYGNAGDASRQSDAGGI